MNNYYEILGITDEAVELEIYDAYRNKISQFNHLRFHTPKMIKEIKLLKEALYVLGDENKRKKYDKKTRLLKQYEVTDRRINNTEICNRLFSITY